MSATVIKLGSSIVADAAGEVRTDVLEQVCDQTAELYREGRRIVLVTSGAIARGMNLMRLPMRPTAMHGLQAASAVGQGKLYRAYDELLAARGLTSAQVLLTFFDMSARSHYLNARQTLSTLLEWGVVPVINENDTTATDEITFGDNDFLAAQVAILVEADKLVLLTGVDGVYTADPRTDPSAAIVREITDFESLDEQAAIGDSTSTLGSGGMRSKVVAAEMSTAAGIPAAIVNGLRHEALGAVLAGATDEGTHFPARALGISSFKLWLRYAKPSHGTVIVDAGAARALREGGTSLLPVGVVDVLGSFAAGDAVEIRHADDDGPGGLLGKGIANLSAAELRRVKGMQSSAAREVLPRAAEEAVHRDYFVLA
jgi:glutamate 5-kinase